MDQYELRLFLHLSSTLHFGKTGTECGISTSALSRTVQRLEQEVGSRLLERDKRSVRLTPAGVRFREYAVDALDRWEELRGDLAGSPDTLRGEISLYGSVTAAFSLLPDIVNAFRASYPQVHLRLRTGDEASALPKLLADEADIAVAARPDRLDPSISFFELARTPLVFVDLKRVDRSAARIEPSADRTEADTDAAIDGAPPGAAGRLGRVAGAGEAADVDWSSVPMILSERGLARDRVESWFRSRGIEPRVYAEVAGNEALLAMVRLGCGVGVVPRLVLENSPFRDFFEEARGAPVLESYRVGICLLNKRLQSPLIRAFRDTVMEVSRGRGGGSVNR